LSGAPGIDQLIATLPDRVQQNQLRQAQTEEEQENVVQNALALRQNIAGQNALRQIYSNPNAINAQTGLPTPQGLSPLFQANPQMGLTMLDTMGKIQDAQSRTNLTNFKIRDEQNQVLMDNVAKPIIEYDQEMKDKGIDPAQRQIRLQQRRQELLTSTQAEYGLPDSVIDIARNVPVDELPGRYELNQQRQANIAKGWEGPYTDSSGKQYWLNKYLGAGAWNADRSAPYTPTGQAENKNIPKGIQTDTFVNKDTGKSESNQFVFGPDGQPVSLKTGQPYKIQGNVSGTPKAGATNKFLPAPLDAEVKKADGSYEMRPVRQQQNPDGTITTTYASGKEAGQEVPADKLGEIRPASAARPRSAATAYINKFMEEHPDATADEVSEAAAKFAVQQGGARAFLAGGKQGDSVRFIGNVVGSHLPTLETLATGLQNNDVRLVNSLKNKLQDQFGWTGPANFDAAKTIVGGEIVKAIQGYAGAESDRERVLAQLADSRTEAQLGSVIYTMKSLMSGQLAGLYRQAKTAGVSDDQFYSLLPPGAKNMLQKELGTESKQGVSSDSADSNSASLPTQKFNSLDGAIKGAPAGKVVSWSGTTFYKDDNGRVHKYVNGAWQ
jgi:hypothetical protein